ncbi:aldo/keto reductase [Nonomuraea dietziae]|uniref:aldo/keto reductase n=1 Tax=Nonomuraea dietziae TaxID=65515 RepID=UPI003CD0A12E
MLRTWNSGSSAGPARGCQSVGLGTWQLGADWGEVEEKDALAVLDAAVEEGVTFFDTADVYGDGRSEQPDRRPTCASAPDAGVTVATKMGRRVALDPRPLHPSTTSRLDRQVPREPGRGPSRPGAAALPAPRRSTPPTRSSTRWTRSSRRAGSPPTG